MWVVVVGGRGLCVVVRGWGGDKTEGGLGGRGRAGGGSRPATGSAACWSWTAATPPPRDAYACSEYRPPPAAAPSPARRRAPPGRSEAGTGRLPGKCGPTETDGFTPDETFGPACCRGRCGYHCCHDASTVRQWVQRQRNWIAWSRWLPPYCTLLAGSMR